MHFLHSRRIVHMDLKSPNILLGESGTAKIADVGLARVMGSDSIINQVVRHAEAAAATARLFSPFLSVVSGAHLCTRGEVAVSP